MGNVGIAFNPPTPSFCFRIMSSRNRKRGMQSTDEKILWKKKKKKKGGAKILHFVESFFLEFFRNFFFLIYNGGYLYWRMRESFVLVECMVYRELLGCFEGLRKFYWTIYCFCSRLRTCLCWSLQMSRERKVNVFLSF